MKKSMLFVLPAAVLSCGLVSCGEKPTFDVALVTDSGTINDESFNQAAWNGIQDYCKQNEITYKYYQPVQATNEERMNSIDAACAAKAKIVVLPGFLFESVSCDAATKYPDVKFVLLDGSYKNDKEYGLSYDSTKEYKNFYCVSYKEEQPGFLAGYAAVKDGYRKLGFLGGIAVPAVKRYGYGFVQGAEKAAQELDVNVTMNYYYAGLFNATDASNTLMKTWVNGGTEVIFGCGGGVYTSIKDAIVAANKGKMIGVDVDQASVGNFVITSAMKGLKETVISALTTFFGEQWSTLEGHVDTLGLGTTAAATNFVGLPTATTSWKFTNFTQANYTELLGKVRAGTYVINDTTNDVASGDAMATLLSLSKVTVTYNA